MGRTCSTHKEEEEEEEEMIVVVLKSAGKRPLGRLKSSWEDNIKMDLSDIG
jgi:hypothetical protein